MSLVNRIQNLCVTEDLTLIGLERELDFSRGSIRKWDTNSPSIDKIEKVAEFFNVSTDYLINHNVVGNDTISRNHEKKDEIFFHLSKKAKELNLSTDDMDLIFEVLAKRKVKGD